MSYLNEIQDLYLKGRQTRSAQSFAKEYPALSILLMAQITRDSELIKQLNALDFKVVFEEVRRLERDIAMTYLQTERDRDIFDFYQGLDLLKRLSRIELTQAEYEAAREALRELDTRKLADFIVSLTHRSLVLSKEWERHIKDAIRFYNVAQGRDRSIDDHLRDFIQNKDEDTAILVFGGFHANGIKEILKQQGLSYVVVSPKITSTDTRHKDYYKRLMSEGHYSFETPFLAARANKSPSSYVMATQMGDYPVERLLQAIASSVGTDNDPRLIERRLAAFNPSQKVQSISAAIETFNIRSEMRVLEEIYPAQDWEALEGMNDRYWAKYGGEFEKAKENDEQPGWFFDRLFGGLPQDAPILEIASGSGRALAVLREKGFTRLTGTDISEEAIAMAAAKGFEVRRLNIKTDRLDGEYSAVMANDILLYLTPREMDGVLNKIRGVLKNGGRFGFRWAAEELPQRPFFLLKDSGADKERWTLHAPDGFIQKILEIYGFRVVGDPVLKDEPIRGGKAFVKYWYFVTEKLPQSRSEARDPRNAEMRVSKDELSFRLVPSEFPNLAGAVSELKSAIRERVEEGSLPALSTGIPSGEGRRKVVYPGSGSDIFSFLLGTNATEGALITLEKASAASADETREALSHLEGTESFKRYLENRKDKTTFLKTPVLEAVPNILPLVIAELFALGVSELEIRTIAANALEIKFDWQHPLDQAPKLRVLTLVHSTDLERPEHYEKFIASGLDAVYSRGMYRGGGYTAGF